VAKKEGYTDIRDAAIDAEAALIKAEQMRLPTNADPPPSG
jgi:hypothetical protein